MVVHFFDKKIPLNRLTKGYLLRTAPVLFLEDRLDLDVAVEHLPMIALQIDRSGNKFIRGDGTSGATQNWLVVDDGFSVQDYSHMSVTQGDIYILPRSGRFFCRFGRRDPAVEGSHVVRVERFTIAVEYLNFVDSTKVDTAVAAQLGH